MARNDWNTQFPTTDELKAEADRLAEFGLDVHTVTITLDNGYWLVTMEATDEDLSNHEYQYELNTYGALEYQKELTV